MIFGRFFSSLTCLRSSPPTRGLTVTYFSNVSCTLRTIAVFASSDNPSSISSHRVSSTSKKSVWETKADNCARSVPSTKTLTMLFCNFMTCLTSAIIPIWYKSSMPGSSCSTSRCATRKIFCSSIILCSTAWIDFSRLTSKCAIIPGRMTIPRSATAGIFIALLSNLFFLYLFKFTFFDRKLFIHHLFCDLALCNRFIRWNVVHQI